MSLFRRRPAAETGADEAAEGASGAQDAPAAVEAAAAPAPAGLSPRPQGPFDVTEVTDEVHRVDLGALRVPGVPGMELRLEVEDGSRRVIAVTVALAGSTAQFQAFAAPRTQGIWAEVRGEIAASLAGAGGATQEVPGPYGTELLARVPAQAPDGTPGTAPARFVGVDGPRWFLRAVFSGPAAVDSEAAAPLEALLRSLVVVRGSEAMAPRDLLPLQLPQGQPPLPAPPQAAAQPGGQREGQPDGQPGPQV